MNNLLKKITNILAISTIIFLIYSCEDDALLTPKVEEECTAGPSYCSLNMPNDKDKLIAYNPERF